ncbi:MAG: MCE family protein [Micromonosporaceae bacterium]
MRRWAASSIAAIAAVAALAACSSNGGSALPLPGGAPRGDHIKVVAEFSDVLDLVPEASVKVNDVSVGSVDRIWLDGWTARVEMRLDKSIKLPDNAMAAVRQTSLLGEKFIALDQPPKGTAQGDLGDGDLIPLARTQRSVEVEEVLSAMAMLLNGGGLAELRTINREVGKALEGREADIKSTLREVNSFIGGLNAQKKDIVRAIDALDSLSKRLAKERGKIAGALDSLGPGLKVLAGQRKDLVSMLKSLRRLGKVGSKVIKESRDETVAVLRDLQPVLTELVKAGADLPKVVKFMLTFPLPEKALDAVHGDMVNLNVSVDLNAIEVLKNLTRDPKPVPDDPDSYKGDQGVPGLPGESNGQKGGLLDLLVGGLTR